MANASTDWPFWLAAALLGALSLFILYRALFRDRSRGRRRCPRCWYDMSGASGLVCPECGRDAKREKRLFRTRRRKRWAVVGVVLATAAIGVANAPGVRRDGWPRLVPTWALVHSFPYCVDQMRGPPSGSVLAAYEYYKLQVGAIRSLPRRTPTIPVSVADQLVLETVRRFASGAMGRRQSIALVRWALHEQDPTSPLSMSTWLLQAISMQGILHDLAPPEEVNRVLCTELRRSVIAPPQWPEGAPIEIKQQSSTLLRAHQGKTRLVIFDQCGGAHVTWTHEYPRLHISYATPDGGPPTPYGVLCGVATGGRVVIRMELWCTKTMAYEDEDFRKVYTTVIELPIEIVRAEP